MEHAKGRTRNTRGEDRCGRSRSGHAARGRKRAGKMRPILLFEMNGSLLKQAGTSATIAEQLLRSKGYELYWLVDGTLQSWQAVKETEFVDCVAMPKEHLGMEAPRSGLDERR